MQSKPKFSYYESSKIILGVISISLALGWGKFLGKTVLLPFYPDYFDVMVGVAVGLFLLLDYAKNIGILTSKSSQLERRVP